MPLFFFYVTINGVLTSDEAGINLDSIVVAHGEATASIRELLDSHGQDNQEIAIAVSDQDYDPLFT